MILSVKRTTPMTTTTRQRAIASLLALFKAEHGTTPQWLIELHHRADDQTLIERLANWKANYPQHFSQHGLYVM
jgi:hypothetical protein